MSAREVERALQNMLLRAVRPLKPGSDYNAFKRRLNAAVRAVRKVLTRRPDEWLVVVEVYGIDPPEEGLVFGSVVFERREPGDGKIGRSLLPIDEEATLEDGEKRRRAEARAQLESHFSGSALGRVKVVACDYEAARDLARAQVSGAICVLNFLSMFEESVLTRRAYLGPDGPRTSFISAAKAPEPGVVHRSKTRANNSGRCA